MGTKKIAILASLDTKLEETMYAKTEVEAGGCEAVLIDVSTKTLLDVGAQVRPCDILKEYGMTWEEFDPLDKPTSIETMSKAVIEVIPKMHQRGLFDGIISVGGGQNARMAANAMKALPFGVPKVVASCLVCGKRTLEQYIGIKDIFVMHTVADVLGLNDVTKSVIHNVCCAAIGMVNGLDRVPEKATNKIRLGATALGITSKGVDGALKLLPNDRFEKTVFHANGVGGRCLEELVEADMFDVVLDMTLHEIACEKLGGYCTGANNRLMKAIEKEIPLVVVPGALDMVDYFVDNNGAGKPVDEPIRKKVYHNANVLHTKINCEEALIVAKTLVDRLNQSKAPTTLILPLKGFCEASAPNGGMFDKEVDDLFISEVKKTLKDSVKLIEVDDNINGKEFQEVVAKEILEITK